MNYGRIGRVPDPTWIIKNWWGRQGGGVYRPLSLFSLSESSSSWYLDKSPSSSSSSWLGKEQTLIKNQNSVTKRFNTINSDFLFAFIYIIFSETAPFFWENTHSFLIEFCVKCERQLSLLSDYNAENFEGHDNDYHINFAF